MSPNPRLKLDLEGGPLTVAVISPEPQLAIELRKAVRVRCDIVVVEGARQADVLVWDTGADGQSSPLALAGTATLALAHDSDSARRALEAGARGVIPRSVDLSGLVAAIIATRYGLSVRDADLERPPAHSKASAEALDMTERELEVLELLSSGQGNRSIANALGISEHTVKFHIASLMNKLEAETRTEAVVSALRLGLIHL